jgi:hypothetical protein
LLLLYSPLSWYCGLSVILSSLMYVSWTWAQWFGHMQVDNCYFHLMYCSCY